MHVLCRCDQAGKGYCPVKKHPAPVGAGCSFFFYFAPKKEKEIISTLRLEKFNVPVFIDYRRKFDELNRLPENQLFRTFLLDENNKIRLIGNPIHGMEKLYLKVLDKQYREDD